MNHETKGNQKRRVCVWPSPIPNKRIKKLMSLSQAETEYPAIFCDVSEVVSKGPMDCENRTSPRIKIKPRMGYARYREVGNA
jgi:hypothetical protein